MPKKALFQSFWERYVWSPEERSYFGGGKINFSSVWDDFIRDPKTESGVSVDQYSALALSAVYRANKVLCDTMQSLPVNVMERTTNGMQIAEDHPNQFLIHSEPNEIQTSQVFRSTAQGNFNFHGNAIAYIHRDRRRVPIRLELFHPHNVEPKVEKRPERFRMIYELTRRVDDTSIEKFLADDDDVLHVPNWSHFGFWGLGYLDVAKEAIGKGLAHQSYGSRFFNNDARPGVVLINKGKLNDKQRKDNRDEWQRTQGKENQHKAAVLDGEWDLKTIAIPPEQAQFVQSGNFTVLDIARFFGVEPHLLYDLDRATFSNIEHQGIQHLVYTIRGIIKLWESEMNKKLFFEDEKNRFFVKFNIDGLLRGDVKSRAEYYRTLFNLGALNSAQIREMERMNKDGASEKFFVQQNMITTEEAEKIKAERDNVLVE